MSRLTGAAALALAAASLSACSGGRPWNVLVITFDTTRADALGCYGNQRARTPALDALAAEGTLFLNSATAAPITFPSHSTIFTGLYPIVHGVRDNGLFQLPDERTTLAEVLKSGGFVTGAAVGAFPITRSTGIAQGFDFFDDHITVGSEDYRGEREDKPRSMFFDERPAARVNDAILPWLRKNARRRFFAWIHYWDPHQPLIPPSPFKDLFAEDLYLGEIAYADRSLGMVFRALKDAGVYDRTLIVFSADHGEGRGEHNEDSHSLLAYDATLRTPLIIRAPGRPGGRRVESRVGTVDILPTILDLLGFAPPAGVQGRSLVPLLANAATPPRQALDHPYYAETLSPRLSFGWGELRVLMEGRYKYIHGPRPELYDVLQDPRETRDLSANPPAEARRMPELLAAFLRKNASAGAASAVKKADPETLARLAALGYISAGGDSPASVQEVLRGDGEAPQARIGLISLSSQVKQALTRRDYLLARDMAEELVRQDPASGVYPGMLIAAHLGLGHLDKAARVAEAVKQVNAQNDAALLQVAYRLFAAERNERGLALARRVVDRHPTAPAHKLLADMNAALGQGELREKELRAALGLDPRHARARLDLAVSLAGRGEAEQAEREFRSLVGAHPLFPQAHMNYGTFLAHAGRLDEAMVQLRRSVELDPAYWRAHVAILALHVERQDRSQAESVFRRIETGCRDPQVLAKARELMGTS